MGLQNGPGTERQIGMEIVCLQNGTGTETPKQIDEIRNQIPEIRNQIPEIRNQIAGNTEADRQENGIR